MTPGEIAIEVLKGRGGFDHWWDDIDPRDQADIVAELDEKLQESAGTS